MLTRLSESVYTVNIHRFVRIHNIYYANPIEQNESCGTKEAREAIKLINKPVHRNR